MKYPAANVAFIYTDKSQRKSLCILASWLNKDQIKVNLIELKSEKKVIELLAQNRKKNLTFWFSNKQNRTKNTKGNFFEIMPVNMEEYGNYLHAESIIGYHYTNLYKGYKYGFNYSDLKATCRQNSSEETIRLSEKIDINGIILNETKNSIFTFDESYWSVKFKLSQQPTYQWKDFMLNEWNKKENKFRHPQETLWIYKDILMVDCISINQLGVPIKIKIEAFVNSVKISP